MRINIWIPDEFVKEVRDRAYRDRKSVSEYLVELHRVNVLKCGDKMLEPAELLKAELIYMGHDEGYKKINPMEVCRNCNKALKFCRC
jgi:hypothetical protein